MNIRQAKEFIENLLNHGGGLSRRVTLHEMKSGYGSERLGEFRTILRDVARYAYLQGVRDTQTAWLDRQEARRAKDKP